MVAVTRLRLQLLSHSSTQIHIKSTHLNLMLIFGCYLFIRRAYWLCYISHLQKIKCRNDYFPFLQKKAFYHMSISAQPLQVNNVLKLQNTAMIVQRYYCEVSIWCQVLSIWPKFLLSASLLATFLINQQVQSSAVEVYAVLHHTDATVCCLFLLFCHQAESELQRATMDATRTTKQLEETIDEFEKQKIRDIKVGCAQLNVFSINKSCENFYYGETHNPVTVELMHFLKSQYC